MIIRHEAHAAIMLSYNGFGQSIAMKNYEVMSCLYGGSPG